MGVALVPWRPTPSDNKKQAPAVEFLSQPLPLNDSSLRRAKERVRRYVAGHFELILPSGKRHRIRFGKLGAEIDNLRLGQLVRDARDPTSPLRRTPNAKGKLILPVPVEVRREAALKELLLLKDRLDRQPESARLNLSKRKLIVETWGQRLDVDGTLYAIANALGKGKKKAHLVFERERPKRLAKELGNVEFDTVLGSFETRYNRARRYAARTFNLRLAASRLDGTVLLPGEIFDFNDVVGPRDEANGYKVAPVIAEGELVDGIGGGTCQISGTLHGAAFFAGLKIVERYPHTRPSSYIKMGLDATVVYPTINFRIKNPFKFPIVLHETVKSGKVRAEILGKRQSKLVTLIRRIDSAIPYEELERLDPKLPSGTRVLGQRGIPGFKLHRYRILRDGNHAVRQRWDDVYPPTTQIVRVGTGDVSKTKVSIKDDPHPEYLADELLVMTHNPKAAEGQSEFLENRVAGRYGERGWTEKSNMPFWRNETATEE